MTMDSRGRLSKDMTELMLKYMPTDTEVELLKSHAQESHTFARADKFLMEMNRLN